LEIGAIRRDIARGKKRSPSTAKMMAASESIGNVGNHLWAVQMLGNEDIEEEAKNEVWGVELKHAKETYENLQAEADAHAGDKDRLVKRLFRPKGLTESDCRRLYY